MPGQPRPFGLDGVHPNMLSHAMFANEPIKAVHAKHGYSIPLVSEYSAWAHDSLQRNPIDLKDFLNHSLFGPFISWVVGVFS